MNYLFRSYNLSPGKKWITALTGFFLFAFLIIHLSGNLTLLLNDDGYSFNRFIRFITHFRNAKVLGYLLYPAIIISVLYSVTLTILNFRARLLKRAASEETQEKWYSGNMGLPGSVLFIFLVVHTASFWYRYEYTDIPFWEYRTDLTGKTISAPYFPENLYFTYSVSREGSTEIVRIKDLYTIVTYSFGHLWYVLLYLCTMVSLGYYLFRGFYSAFGRVGWAQQKHAKLIIWLLSVFIPLTFALIPTVYYVKTAFTDVQTMQSTTPKSPPPRCISPVTVEEK